MLIIEDNQLSYQLPNALVIISAILFLIIVAGFYVLRSLGLYKLAKNNGIKNAFIAFIPCAWFYILFNLVGETSVFGLSFKKYSILFCVICGVAAALPVVYNFIKFFPFVGYYFESLGSQGQIIINTVEGTIRTNPMINNFFNTKFLINLVAIFEWVSKFFDLASIVLTVFSFIALFKKFYPNHYIVYSVLSVMGLFPIFVFIIRNKKAVDFNEYVRNRYYNNPYGPNPYNQNYGNKTNPFDEFNSGSSNNQNNNSNNNGTDNRPEDPFPEFDNKKKK